MAGLRGIWYIQARANIFGAMIIDGLLAAMLFPSLTPGGSSPKFLLAVCDSTDSWTEDAGMTD